MTTTMKRIAKLPSAAACILVLGLSLSACKSDLPNTPKKPDTEKPEPQKPEKPGTEDPKKPDQPGTEDPKKPDQPGTEDPKKPEQPGTEDPKKPQPQKPEENKMVPKFFIKTVVKPESYYGKETTVYTYDGEQRITSVKVLTDGEDDIPTEKTYSYTGERITIKNYYAPGKLDPSSSFSGVIVKNFAFTSTTKSLSTGVTERSVDTQSVKTNSDGRITSFSITETYTVRQQTKEEITKNQELVTITWSGDNISAIKVEKGKLGQSKSVIMEMALEYGNFVNLTNLFILQDEVGRSNAGDQVFEMNVLPHNAMQPRNFPTKIVRKDHIKTGVDVRTFTFQYEMDTNNNRPTGFTRLVNGAKATKYLITY